MSLESISPPSIDKPIHLIENRAPVLSPIYLCVPARRQAYTRADPLPQSGATSVFPSALTIG